MRALLAGLCLCGFFAGSFAPRCAAGPPGVAAAADLKFALEEIAGRFTEQTGERVRLSFGSSGNFTHQILHGAPYELFLSADEAYVFRLADRGLTRDRGALYAIGRIVLFAPHASSLAVDDGLDGLGAALAAGGIRRFAIANPEHAPYGRAARAALRTAGLWECIEPLLVLGENAAQATQFALSGSVQGGIVPLSLALVPQIAAQGAYVQLPAEVHADEPLRQRMVLLSSAGATAAAFYAYLQEAEARAAFVAYGFVLPGESAE